MIPYIYSVIFMISTAPAGEIVEMEPYTSVTIWNTRVDEPVTALTDLLFATVCLYAFFRLKKLDSQQRAQWYLKYYFLTMGLGAFFGGLFGHAFFYGLAPSWKLLSWVFVLLSVACVIRGFLELARPLLRVSMFRLFNRINLLMLATALFLTIWTLAFSAVKFYTIVGIFGIAGSLSYYLYWRTGDQGMTRVMAAVGLAMISAVVFSFEWGISPWFNHNDISHLLLTISTFIIFRGVTMILETPVPAPPGPSHI